MRPLASVVIRTLNEERHLEELLAAIRDQNTPDFDVEVVLVDSGSTDSTLPIADAVLLISRRAISRSVGH